jgi:hypothetical protein
MDGHLFGNREWKIGHRMNKSKAGKPLHSDRESRVAKVIPSQCAQTL